ncbi:glycosyl transferase [Liquorilactobacillus aquaticus DSM 21051]|uniref:UDP-N-acetylglucosamine--peptide N-acetylglucosaminyltransferase GtfA subunit n=1 Tax=Liquorilactobacillus aquaticus DSM 21051 TaxID=1423725 RepID=A0A0R2CUL7_9LACO|nr:accessory Sec system glycosyltransferase GtfA [Liquorilactobacillus aquaticus]KRM95061.1 glycosyl transferase [Liquorilactobacillus aquaticus DSM 21051]
MTVYNFNLGIGWASSGVEYAQAYRARLLRNIKQSAKFVFTDLILNENIEHMTKNIGFTDNEIIWLYQYFTDVKISPTTYTLKQLEKSINFKKRKGTIEHEGAKIVRYHFEKENKFVTAFLKEPSSNIVERVEHVSHDFLIRKDYFTYTKLLSEYYTPRDNRAYLYQRRFFNEDGSIAYEQIVDGTNEFYRMKDRILYSKIELINYFLEKLALTSKDVLLLDRATSMGQSVFRNRGAARLGVVVHAEHFSENASDDKNILWNNYYEYQFDYARYVDFFITATDVQNKLMKEHFKKYCTYVPDVVTIPVGSLDKLRYPEKKRKPRTLITASRLASEKHIDWLILAVVKAHKSIPQLVLDIYGSGGEHDKLLALINYNKAGSYIHLKGHMDLTEVYKNYEAYITASTSEGFGLTLLEAVGSGLPLIGLNVRYGNQTFIENGQNGFLIQYRGNPSLAEITDEISAKILKLFKSDNLHSFSKSSYLIGKKYLEHEVEQKWERLLEG